MLLGLYANSLLTEEETAFATAFAAAAAAAPLTTVLLGLFANSAHTRFRSILTPSLDAVSISPRVRAPHARVISHLFHFFHPRLRLRRRWRRVGALHASRLASSNDSLDVPRNQHVPCTWIRTLTHAPRITGFG